MKILIFAGGTGTRMWPLSRKSLPKQFIKMFNGKSTLELAVNRVKSFGLENIYVSTLQKYIPLVKKTVPNLKPKNIIGEPDLRNVAPAIGYNLIRLRAQGYKGPVAILWADHLMKNKDNFLEILRKGRDLVKKNPNQIVFFGEKPRFANNNLGWIHIGKKIQSGAYKFIEWYYKPTVKKCNKMFTSGKWLWNPGYFLMDLDFALSLYEKLQPEMYKKLVKMEKAIGTKKETVVVKNIYPTLERIHFDKAILEKIPPEKAVVVKTNMGWSDPGTLYALKEALVKQKDKNLTEGTVYTKNTRDSLIINKEKKKLVATVGLEGVAVVNTENVTLVVPKDSILEVTELIKELKENPKLKKYI